MAKKVGTLKDQVAEKEKKEKGRTVYDSTELVAQNAEAVNADKLLTVAPTGYDYRKNQPMKKENFVSESIYLKYQSLVATQKSEFYALKASELDGKSTRLEKFGSEAARKAATKLARAKQQMAILRTQLMDSGMDEAELDALIAAM